VKPVKRLFDLMYKSELLSLDVFDTKKRAHEQSTAIEDVRKRYFHNEGQLLVLLEILRGSY